MCHLNLAFWRMWHQYTQMLAVDQLRRGFLIGVILYMLVYYCTVWYEGEEGEGLPA